MSRSFKRTKIFGVTTSKSEKVEKIIIHKKFRRICKNLLKTCRISSLLYSFREISNVWSMSKDGKFYWRDAPKKYMRK